MLPGDLISYVKKVSVVQMDRQMMKLKSFGDKSETFCSRSGSSTGAKCSGGEISKGSTTSKAKKHNQLNRLQGKVWLN